MTSRRLLVAITALAGFVVVAGTSDPRLPASAATGQSVPMFRGNAARTGESPGPGPVGTPELLWRARLGQHLSSSPAVDDGVVFIGSVAPISPAGGALHAVDAVTGEERWRIEGEPGDGVLSSPAVDSRGVYWGTFYGDVVLASFDGRELWRTRLDSSILSSPALSGGALIATTEAGILSALDAATGVVLWTFAPAPPFELAMPSPAVDGGTVFAIAAARRVGGNASLHALDLQTGMERWHFVAPAGGPLRGIPVISGGRVHVFTLDGVVFALDAEDGQVVWRSPPLGRVSTAIAAAGGTLFVPTEDGVVHALRLDSGDETWNARLTDNVRFAAPPVFADDVVYLGDADGILHALDVESTVETWTADARAYQSSPAVIGGRIYIGGDDGSLRAIGGTPVPSAGSEASA
jgi:outer membrane protein assembly factor BamB